VARRIVHYQTRDANVVDYRIYFRPDCDIGFRGPRVPDHLGFPFGVALGSAATFGRFVHQPYPEQLTHAGFPTVNLGISGARPQVFRLIGGLSSLLKRAAFTVLEVMACRGYALDFFQPIGPAANMGRYIGLRAQGASAERGPVFVNQAWEWALRAYSPAQIDEFIAASRTAYLSGMQELIDMVEGDLLLLWFSQRPPAYQPNHVDLIGASGGYPHFVNAEIVDHLIEYARGVKGNAFRYVEIISSVGLPMTLYNRFDGKPEPVFSTEPGGSTNTYYPSQEMHDLTATTLVSGLLNRENAWPHRR
jgi:uncharacterized protein DUF6473